MEKSISFQSQIVATKLFCVKGSDFWTRPDSQYSSLYVNKYHQINRFQKKILGDDNNFKRHMNNLRQKWQASSEPTPMLK